MKPKFLVPYCPSSVPTRNEGVSPPPACKRIPASWKTTPNNWHVIKGSIRFTTFKMAADAFAAFASLYNARAFERTNNPRKKDAATTKGSVPQSQSIWLLSFFGFAQLAQLGFHGIQGYTKEQKNNTPKMVSPILPVK